MKCSVLFFAFRLKSSSLNPSCAILLYNYKRIYITSTTPVKDIQWVSITTIDTRASKKMRACPHGLALISLKQCPVDTIFTFWVSFALSYLNLL